MNLLLAGLVTAASFYAFFWRNDIQTAIGFMAWGCALYNRHEIEELKAKVRARG